MPISLLGFDLGDVTFAQDSYDPFSVILRDNGSAINLSTFTGFTGTIRKNIDTSTVPFSITVENNNDAVQGQIIIKVTAAQLTEAGMDTKGGLMDIYAVNPANSNTEQHQLAYSRNVIVQDNAATS